MLRRRPVVVVVVAASQHRQQRNQHLFVGLRFKKEGASKVAPFFLPLANLSLT
jgi:hypothetical protein